MAIRPRTPPESFELKEGIKPYQGRH
jgi:hypothetical protein